MVKVHQRVQVTVLEVDLDRKRIGLSMKSAPEPGAARAPRTGPVDAGRRPDRPAPQPQSPARTSAPDWFTLALNKAKQEKSNRGRGGNG